MLRGAMVAIHSFRLLIEIVIFGLLEKILAREMYIPFHRHHLAMRHLHQTPSGEAEAEAETRGRRLVQWSFRM